MNGNMHVQVDPMITTDWIEVLQKLFDSADLDGALSYIAGIHPETLASGMDPGLSPLLSLRARCLICEVYDYAGRTRDAALCIQQEGECAYEDLKAAKSQTATVWNDSVALEYLKQECWACLHSGMLAYRRHDYEDAFERFELTRKILARMNSTIPSNGSLARAHYCLGLVERERHQLYDARRHFSASVDLGWLRFAEKAQAKQPVGFIQYNIGRALGLGMAWISYARASMADANAYIAGARLLLHQIDGVEYLRNYVSVVHSCTERSSANTIPRILEAIVHMNRAYQALGGNTLLKNPSANGHFLYAQRAAYELATAHLCAARLYDQQIKPLETTIAALQEQYAKSLAQAQKEIATSVQEKKPGQTFQQPIDPSGEVTLLRQQIDRAKQEEQLQLSTALDYATIVEESLGWNDKAGNDKRTRCNILIAKSRIFRAMGKYDQAFEEAERATAKGEHNPFSRIDCYITLGEAYFYRGDHEKALKQFGKARNDRRAQTNSKILATCDLQMALCYIKLKQFPAAREIRTRWEKQGFPGRANAFVQHLEKKIDDQLSDKPFILPDDLDDKYLKEADRVNELKLWLTNLAYHRTGTYEGAADLIGRDQKTVRSRLEGAKTKEIEVDDF